MHRKQLLASDVAACYHCFAEYPPSAISEWCDGDNQDQTAICPRCSVDAVVGFDGPVAQGYLKAAHLAGFGTLS